MTSKNVGVVCGVLLLLGLPVDPSAGQTKFAKEAPDPAAWTLSLDGQWEFAPPDSDDYQVVPVPGYWGQTPQGQKATYKVTSTWKSATYRRDIQVPQGMTGAMVEFDQLPLGRTGPGQRPGSRRIRPGLFDGGL